MDYKNMGRNYRDAEEVETVDSFSKFENSRPTQHLPANQSDLEYVKEFQKNIELDAKLGLEGQAKEDAKELIDNDIAEILRGEPYTEVTMNDLEKLFGIPEMRRKSMVWNFYHKYKWAMGCLLSAIILTNISWATSHSEVFVYDGVTSLTEFWVGITAALSALGAVTSAVFSIKFTMEDEIPDHPKLVIDLDVEDVRNTRMKIPYGAKLRLEEAFETGKFDSFKIAYPKPYIVNVAKPAPKIVDPAIIGCKKNKLTGSEKWYMIVFWDIPKDKEITEKKIKQLKKFKLV